MSSPWIGSSPVSRVSTVGILPEPDDPWTRGKGGYKALLYMAVGIPVVASRVRVNSEIVVAGKTGYSASSNEEWVDALRRLVADQMLRERMGAAGRARVVDRCSVRVIAPQLAAAVRAALDCAAGWAAERPSHVG